MDWNRVEGNWKQVKGKVKEKWGDLTDDDLTAINGQRDQLEGKIQERYGLAKDKVRRTLTTGTAPRVGNGRQSASRVSNVRRPGQAEPPLRGGFVSAGPEIQRDWRIARSLQVAE
jgi:uncharacterized protein YjbJ (UPF0337 family)